MDRDLSKALKAFLSSDSSITTLSGARIYSNRMSQNNSGTAIIYQRISEISDYHMNGQSSIVRARMQITCWATLMEDAVNLADKVKTRLSGAKGFWPYGSNSPRDTVEVLGVFVANHRDLYDSTAELNGMSRDFEILYQEGN